jgi:hypothetical protein
MSYPNVSWLIDADMVLVDFIGRNEVATSLGLKTELRTKLPGVNIRQAEISEYLAQAWRDNKFPHTYSRNFIKTSSGGSYAVYALTTAPSTAVIQDDEEAVDDEETDDGN